MPERGLRNFLECEKLSRVDPKDAVRPFRLPQQLENFLEVSLERCPCALQLRNSRRFEEMRINVESRVHLHEAIKCSRSFELFSREAEK